MKGGSGGASLVPSNFPPGMDPNVILTFQMADRDGSGFIDDLELQKALTTYRETFSLRTVHLLMYLFTNSNTRKIGPKEFTSVYYSLQSWRSIFEKNDRDHTRKIDASELSEALRSLGFVVSPVVLDLLVAKSNCVCYARSFSFHVGLFKSFHSSVFDSEPQPLESVTFRIKAA